VDGTGPGTSSSAEPSASDTRVSSWLVLPFMAVDPQFVTNENNLQTGFFFLFRIRYFRRALIFHRDPASVFIFNSPVRPFAVLQFL
jgi:hypothetical protein